MYNQKAQALCNSIDKLKKSSRKFVAAIQDNNTQDIKDASANGISSLDALITGLLRLRDDSKAKEFKNSGIGEYYKIKPSKIEQLRNQIQSQKSLALLEFEHSTPIFELLLNKIKHSKADKNTFEIMSDQSHLLILTGDEFQNQNPYVLLFKVEELCDFSSEYVNLAQKYY